MHGYEKNSTKGGLGEPAHVSAIGKVKSHV